VDKGDYLWRENMKSLCRNNVIIVSRRGFLITGICLFLLLVATKFSYAGPSAFNGKVAEWKCPGCSGFAVITNVGFATNGRGQPYIGPGLYYFGSSLYYAYELIPDPNGNKDNDSAYCYLVEVGDTFPGPCVDSDQDGFYAKSSTCPLGDDPDDNDPDIYTGGPEICGDGKDNNDNGLVDEGCYGDSCPLNN
jgi:hypothetical protein